jgi:hypothetical protein
MVEAELKARKFSLVDDNGTTRAALDLVFSGPCLTFFDEQHQKRLELQLGVSGPRLVFFDEQGRRRTEPSCDNDGGYQRLSMYGSNPKVMFPLVNIGTVSGESSHIELYGPDGKYKAQLEYTHEAGSALILRDADSNVLISMSTYFPTDLFELRTPDGETLSKLP